MSQHKCVGFAIFSAAAFLRCSELWRRNAQAAACVCLYKKRAFRSRHRHASEKMCMGESLTARAMQHRGRGQVFDSVVDAIGDTPIVRLQRLPKQRGANATILAKL